MKRLLLSLALALLGVTLFAQTSALDYFLPDSCHYDPSVPTPASVLGFEVGEFQASHAQGVAYIQAVAAASDRVKVIEYGRSHERKPLLLVVISSPDHIRNLDALKAAHARLTDPADNAPTDGPVFTWLGHSIHGNETSGFNASLLLLYHLAAARTPYVERLLQESVILIDPVLNPDGLDRFTLWANTHRSLTPNPDTQEMEHAEPWPGGRSNHYWFDLNRDWINQTQPESQARIAAMLEWNPNVYTCSHEQQAGANFHFSPGVPSRVHPLIPDACQSLIRRLSEEYYVPAFDRQGLLYFSGEQYDDYYPGRGREYLDFHGGIALLWEQPSPRGFLRETANGLLSFPMAVHNQLTMQLATLQGSCELRTELLQYQKTFYRQGLAEGKGYYVFGSSRDRMSCLRLAETVSRNGVEVYRLGAPLTVDGKRFVPDSAFVVPVHQKRSRMVEALFEVRKEFADSVSYDITGWTMPMLYGLEYARVAAVRLGEAWVPEPAQSVSVAKASYAYAFAWGGYYAPRALYRLQQAGVRTRVAQAPFRVGDKELGRGSVVVPLGPMYQSVPVEEIHGLMTQIASEDGVEVLPVNSGHTGLRDLGSGSFATVGRPSVAALGGDGASSATVGALWHLMDVQYRMPLSILPSGNLAKSDLERYDVLFVTAAHETLPEPVCRKLRAWVESGHTLVTFGRGAVLASHRLGVEDLTFRVRNVSGAILSATGDPAHPLLWGFDAAHLAIFKDNSLAVGSVPGTSSVPLRFDDDPLLSGNLTPYAREAVAGPPAIVVSSLGRGRIVSLLFDPNFRGASQGTALLTANALWFAPLVRR